MKIAANTLTALVSLSVLSALPSAKAETCEATLSVVQELYNRTVDICPDGDTASDCSGLLIRGTHRADPAKGQAFDIWNPSPNALRIGSIAFSYLRKDINFDDPGMDATNGFITTPFDYLCQGQQGAHLQCAFTSDGWTDYRNDRGCFDNNQTSKVEGFCQDTGITTGAKWLAQFLANQPANGVWGPYPYQAQCGFDMARGRGQAGRAAAFKTFLESRRLVNNREFMMQTEVRVSNPGNDQMPVLAFFTEGPHGLADALANQRDYLARTGQFRPVIAIDFPKTPGGVATFSCAPNQMRPPASVSTPGFCRAGRSPSPGFAVSPKPIDQATQAALAAQLAQAQSAVAAATAAQAQADAKRCKPYIKESKWIQRDDPVLGAGIWSLSITPTDCGRAIGPDETDRMYAELYNKHSNDPQWRQYADNFGSMRRQFVCHLANSNARKKAEWNLEPVRPYVSHEAMLNLSSPCNPGPADKGK